MDRLAAVLAAAFRLLARLRRGRALHPLGVGYHARLEITPGAGRWAGARLLVPGARYDAVVRFSRGGGLPEPLPDALGVAVRLPDAYGPGRARTSWSPAPPTCRWPAACCFRGAAFCTGRSAAPSPTGWAAGRW
jgi:hypothetical protein